jgi:hypothetical protein
MMLYKGVEVELHASLTSALDASRPSRFTPGERALGTIG